MKLSKETAGWHCEIRVSFSPAKVQARHGLSCKHGSLVGIMQPIDIS